jgi:hypothetical protein
MNHEQFRYLMSKTFRLEFITLYRDYKGNLILRFEELEVSLRVKKGWTFTWPDFTLLVNELINEQFKEKNHVINEQEKL